jgi:hypothetical protein
MSSTKSAVQPHPAWDVARLFPNQGHWTEGDYLVLNRNTNRFVELVDGEVAALEMPTRSHQRTVLYLRDRLRDFTHPRQLGEVVIAPYPVRLGSNRFREPDVVFMLDEHADRLGEDFAERGGPGNGSGERGPNPRPRGEAPGIRAGADSGILDR